MEPDRHRAPGLFGHSFAPAETSRCWGFQTPRILLGALGLGLHTLVHPAFRAVGFAGFRSVPGALILGHRAVGFLGFEALLSGFG